LIVFFGIYWRSKNEYVKIFSLVLIFLSAFCYIEDKDIYDVSIVFIWLYALRSIAVLHILNRTKVISTTLLVIIDICIIISI